MWKNIYKNTMKQYKLNLKVSHKWNLLSVFVDIMITAEMT